MGEFTGFADGDARFFKRLAKNQDRAWFQEHKAEYEEGWSIPMKALLGDVRAAVDSSYERCDLDEPKVFRIFRDVRFAKDKTPYKTHVAGIIGVARSAKVTETPAALYFHVGLEVIVAAGLYRMDGPSLERYRKAVVDDQHGAELDAILKKLARAGLDTDSMSEDTLKKVPRGFDPEHPRAELLKKKGLGVSFPAPPKELYTSPKLVGWLAERAKKAAPLVEWLTVVTA
jgi:uncharacterized protein (TIGR02453 family)